MKDRVVLYDSLITPVWLWRVILVSKGTTFEGLAPEDDQQQSFIMRLVGPYLLLGESEKAIITK